MPSTQEIYEVVLQLKDELSAGLRTVNATLGQTRDAGKTASEGVKTAGETFRQTIKPIRDFAFEMRNILNIGGVAILIRQVAMAAGQMQLAYEKANPAAAAAAGSLTNWNAAMADMKVKAGGIMDTVLNPIRSFFIDLIDPLFRATQELKDFSAWTDTIIKQYGSEGLLGQIKYEEALVKRGIAEDKINDALAKQAGLVMEVKKAQELLYKMRGLPTAGEGEGAAKLLYGQSPGEAQLALDVASNALSANIAIISEAEKDLKALTDWLKANPGGIKAPPPASVVPPAFTYPATLAERLRKFGDMLDDLGGVFTPAMFTYPALFAERLRKFGDMLGDLVESFAPAIFTYPVFFAEKLRKFGDVLGDVAEPAALPEPATFTYPTLFADMLRKFGDMLGELVPAEPFQANTDYYRMMMDVAKNTKTGTDYLKVIADIEKDRAAAQQRLSLAQSFFASPTGAVSNLLQTSATTAAGNVGAAGGGGIMQLVAEFFTVMGVGLEGMLSAIAQMAPLVLLVMALGAVFQGIMDIIGPSLEGLWKPFAEIFKLLGNTIGTLLLPIFGALEPLFTAICAVVAPFINLLMIFEPLFKLIGNVIKIFMIPVLAFVIAIVVIMNLIIDGLNWAFGWLGVNIQRAAVPAMPTFHEGGVAQDETVALLKKGEIVTNPYKNTSYIAGGGPQVGGVTIYAPNARYLDGGTAAELVRLGLAAMRA